jgi:hypothetical protein
MFPKRNAVIPSSIGNIILSLEDTLSGGAQVYTKKILFNFEILDQNNEMLVVSQGDLIDHLSPAKLNAVKNFMNDIRTQIETETLP